MKCRTKTRNQVPSFFVMPFWINSLVSCYAHFNISVLLTFYIYCLVFYIKSRWIYGVDYLVK